MARRPDEPDHSARSGECITRSSVISRLKRRKEALQLNSFVTGRKLPFDVDGGEDRVIAELRSRLHVLVNPENLREFNYRWAL